MLKLIILNCRSGFSNRFLPLLSFYSYCKEKNIDLAVIWHNNTCRSCLKIETSKYMLLNDYFKFYPKNIYVFTNIDEIIKKYNFEITDLYKINMEWKNIIPNDFYKHEYIMIDNVYYIISLLEQYNMEKLISLNSNMFIVNDFVEENINKILKLFDINKDILGIHMRTTDGGFAEYNKEYLFNDIDNIIKNNNEKYNIFFCTDDLNNQNIMLNKYNNIIIYDNNNKFINSNISTLLSLIDLYILSKCDIIYGTPGSTFSLLGFILNQKETKQFHLLKLI